MGRARLTPSITLENKPGSGENHVLIASPIRSYLSLGHTKPQASNPCTLARDSVPAILYIMAGSSYAYKGLNGFIKIPSKNKM